MRSTSADSRLFFIGLRCMRARVPTISRWLNSSDIHQHVFAVWIITVEALNRVLHGSRKFAVSTAELLQQHVAKAGLRTSDIHCVHQFLYVVVHSLSPVLSFANDCSRVDYAARLGVLRPDLGAPCCSSRPSLLAWALISLASSASLSSVCFSSARVFSSSEACLVCPSTLANSQTAPYAAIS